MFNRKLDIAATGQEYFTWELMKLKLQLGKTLLLRGEEKIPKLPPLHTSETQEGVLVCIEARHSTE